MPPKARTGSTGIKRKSRDEEEPEEPVKRTRSRGAPTHYIPLDGAPEAPKSLRPLERSDSSANSKATRHVLKPVQLPTSRQKQGLHRGAKLLATKKNSSQSSSEDELSMSSPSKSHSLNAPNAMSQHTRNLIAEVEILNHKPILRASLKMPHLCTNNGIMLD